MYIYIYIYIYIYMHPHICMCDEYNTLWRTPQGFSGFFLDIYIQLLSSPKEVFATPPMKRTYQDSRRG